MKKTIILLIGLTVLSVGSMALASSNATVPPNQYQVAKIEVNVFGTWPNLRCAVLFWAYYNGELHVIDWRWCEAVGMKLVVGADGRVSVTGNLPEQVDGRYYLMWDNNGVPYTVIGNERVYIGSPQDRELQERNILPEDKRPKLTGTGGVYSSTEPITFPQPSPAPSTTTTTTSTTTP